MVASYTTDAEGSFISDYFISDSDWTLREISPSEGYLLDESVYTIPAEPGNFEIELNQIPISVTEQVIMGRIRLIKHIDKEQDDIENVQEAKIAKETEDPSALGGQAAELLMLAAESSSNARRMPVAAMPGLSLKLQKLKKTAVM